MTSSKKAPASSPTRRGWLGWAVAAAGLGAAGVAAWRFGATPSVPQPPSDWWSHRLAPPQGDGTVALETFRGKPLLVNFWATWCPPCIREMPVIDAFARAQGADGWQVLGLAIDRRDAVVEFLRKQPVSYAIGLAGFDGTQWSRDLGNAQGGLPFTAAFDAQGALRHRRLGEISAEELASWTRG